MKKIIILITIPIAFLILFIVSPRINIRADSSNQTLIDYFDLENNNQQINFEYVEFNLNSESSSIRKVDKFAKELIKFRQLSIEFNSTHKMSGFNPSSSLSNELTLNEGDLLTIDSETDNVYLNGALVKTFKYTGLNLKLYEINLFNEKFETNIPNLNERIFINYEYFNDVDGLDYDYTTYNLSNIVLDTSFFDESNELYFRVPNKRYYKFDTNNLMFLKLWRTYDFNGLKFIWNKTKNVVEYYDSENQMIELEITNNTFKLPTISYGLFDDTYRYYTQAKDLSNGTIYLARGLRKLGSKILSEDINSRFEILNTQKFIHYYDREKTLIVKDIDVISDDLYLTVDTVLDESNSIVNLSFDTLGGNEIDDIVFDLSITGNMFFTLAELDLTLPVAYKDGYIFTGWIYETTGYTFTETSAIRESMTITAEYVRIGDPISVSFLNRYTDDYFLINGKKVEQLTFDNYKVGDLIDLKELNLSKVYKTNYIFVGWDFDFSQPLTKSIRIEPIFEKREGFIINFEVNGGVALDSLIINEQYILNLEYPVTTKVNNLFLGWFIDKDLTIPAKNNLNYLDVEYYNITLYASWMNNGARIRFETNANDLAYQLSPILVTKGTQINIPNPPKRNYHIFVGWFTDEQLTLLYENTPIYDDEITLYAKWEIDPDNQPPENWEEENEEIDYMIFLAIPAGLLAIMIFYKLLVPESNSKSTKYKKKNKR